MFRSQIKITLAVIRSIFIRALIAAVYLPMSIGFTQDSLVLETVDDVKIRSVPGLSGLVTVTLESSSGENLLRIIDLDRHIALRPSAINQAITDVSASHSAPGMVYSESPKSGGGLLWSLLDGTMAMRLTLSSLPKAGVTFGRRPGDYLFVGEFGPDSKEIFSISSTTSPSLTQLTRLGGRNTTPHVNPRTGVIAYSTSRKFPGWDVCLFDPDTNRDTCPLSSATVSFCRPKWSPIGDQFVYSRGQGSSIDLYTYKPETGEGRRISSLAHKEYDGAWSPDATHIVFSHNPSGTDLYELKVVRLSDGEVFSLANSPRSMRGASWIAAQPYVEPTAEPPSQTPAGPPTEEVGQTPQPVEETPNVLRAPKVTMKGISRSRALVTVASQTPLSTGHIMVRLQVQGRSVINRTARRLATFYVSRHAVVRAAIRGGQAQSFSEWSPWMSARSTKG